LIATDSSTIRVRNKEKGCCRNEGSFKPKICSLVQAINTSHENAKLDEAIGVAPLVVIP